ncbi:MAG: hypothetical protein ACE5GV_00220 [Candidatus Scalindua sp.]
MKMELNKEKLFIIWRTPVLTFVLLVFIYLYLSKTGFNPLEFGLAKNMHSVEQSFIDGHLVQASSSEIEVWKNALPNNTDSVNRLIVWTGNSHLHAINNYKDGQQPAAFHLHKLLNGNKWPGKYPVLGISYPNISFFEQFLLTLFLCVEEALPHPLIIVNGYRYADTRENTLREIIKPILYNTKVNRWILENHERLKNKYPLALKRLQNEINVKISKRESINIRENIGDSKISEIIGNFVPLFNNRNAINGIIRTSIRSVRDFVFNIDSTSKRPILMSRYKEAMEFMELASEVSKMNNTYLLIYNIPLRPVADNPYPASDYSKYCNDMRAIAKKYAANVYFLDYENVIPVELWGYYDSGQPDFAHFKEEGHILFARKLEGELSALGLLR